MVKSEYIESDGEESKVKNESKKVSRSKSPAKLLKKRTRKESSMAKCDFLDFEAEESDHQDRKGSKRSVKFDDQILKRGK